MNFEKPDIVFMGSPEFAVESLKILKENDYNIKAVVTAPDKPAGRGKKIKFTAVKNYAIQNNLNILQPISLKDKGFIETLKSLKAKIFVVVAFRILPKDVFEIPLMGCFNLHASLLPDYRGAAPINHVLINGEKITGVTSFFINQNIDTGDIILQESEEIKEHYNAGDLHDILMYKGAELVLKTVEKISSGNFETIPQNNLMKNNEKPAPKINKEFCEINWNKNCIELHNFIRGLSPYPCAYTKIKDNKQNTRLIKILEADFEIFDHEMLPGKFVSDNKSYLKISCNDGFILIKELQLEGKKKLPILEFLKGNNINEI